MDWRSFRRIPGVREAIVGRARARERICEGVALERESERCIIEGGVDQEMRPLQGFQIQMPATKAEFKLTSDGTGT